jgi:hypothetical protein
MSMQTTRRMVLQVRYRLLAAVDRNERSWERFDSCRYRGFGPAAERDRNRTVRELWAAREAWAALGGWIGDDWRPTRDP